MWLTSEGESAGVNTQAHTPHSMIQVQAKASKIAAAIGVWTLGMAYYQLLQWGIVGAGTLKGPQWLLWLQIGLERPVMGFFALYVVFLTLALAFNSEWLGKWSDRVFKGSAITLGLFMFSYTAHALVTLFVWLTSS